MEQQQIKVYGRRVYGQVKWYPTCDKAHGFAALLQQQTLTKQQIERIKNIGFQVLIVPDPELAEVL